MFDFSVHAISHSFCFVDTYQASLKPCREERDTADDMHRRRAEMARKRVIQAPLAII